MFFLKYLFSSQSAILWMSALFALAMVCYWIGFFSPTAAWLGTALTWGAVFAGTTGMLVRWREGHLMGPDLGHIPVSNLYEVFVLFALITALFYLYYERKYATRALGGFVLLVVTSAVVFLLWYSFTRDAGQIQPLVPALKSWWMKLHVPANFIGYGTFAGGHGGLRLPGQAARPDLVLARWRRCSCWACCCAPNPWCSARKACRPPGCCISASAR